MTSAQTLLSQRCIGLCLLAIIALSASAEASSNLPSAVNALGHFHGYPRQLTPLIQRKGPTLVKKTAYQRSLQQALNSMAPLQLLTQVASSSPSNSVLSSNSMLKNPTDNPLLTTQAFHLQHQTPQAIQDKILHLYPTLNILSQAPNQLWVRASQEELHILNTLIQGLDVPPETLSVSLHWQPNAPETDVTVASSHTQLTSDSGALITLALPSYPNSPHQNLHLTPTRLPNGTIQCELALSTPSTLSTLPTKAFDESATTNLYLQSVRIQPNTPLVLRHITPYLSLSLTIQPTQPKRGR